MSFSLGFGLFPVLAATLIATAPAEITDVANLVDVGASERINYSGKLRLLSQRVAVAACNLEAGVAPDQSATMLGSAAEEFDKIVRALEFGDESLNINGAEARRKTLAALTEVQEAWDPIAVAVRALLVDPGDQAALAVIAAHNMTLLGKAQHLVVELVGEYSNPMEMMQSDAMLVDISGRQRMLSQRMSKEACEIWSGRGGEAAQTALEGSMALFEISLVALRDGMPEAGIEAPPSAQIHDSLVAIHADWMAVKPMLMQARQGLAADAAQRAEVFERLNVILRDMNATVGLYTQSAKTGL